MSDGVSYGDTEVGVLLFDNPNDINAPRRELVVTMDMFKLNPSDHPVGGQADEAGETRVTMSDWVSDTMLKLSKSEVKTTKAVLTELSRQTTDIIDQVSTLYQEAQKTAKDKTNVTDMDLLKRTLRVDNKDLAKEWLDEILPVPTNKFKNADMKQVLGRYIAKYLFAFAMTDAADAKKPLSGRPGAAIVKEVSARTLKYLSGGNANTTNKR